jgi:DNA-binding XRE family transcriptional regulator
VRSSNRNQEMPRPKPTDEDLEQRKFRADALRRFCKEHLFTEVKLAEVLGVSRRTLQEIKAGRSTPTLTNQKKIETLFERHNFDPNQHPEPEPGLFVTTSQTE